MAKRSAELGLKTSIADIDQFEIFLRTILAYEFDQIRNNDSFKKYINNYQDDTSDDIDPADNEEIFRFGDLWCDNLAELIDLAASEKDLQFVDSALENLPPAFAKKLHRAGCGAFEALAEQIHDYFDARDISYDSLYERYNLFIELESRTTQE